MVYKGYSKEKKIPHGRYVAVLNVMQETGWTYDEYMDQPDDLIAELEVRIAKSNLPRK